MPDSLGVPILPRWTAGRRFAIAIKDRLVDLDLTGEARVGLFRDRFSVLYFRRDKLPQKKKRKTQVVMKSGIVPLKKNGLFKIFLGPCEILDSEGFGALLIEMVGEGTASPNPRTASNKRGGDAIVVLEGNGLF